MSPPVILSVLIPVYNASRYLEAALASVSAQTFRHFEIIAVDDGSTDGSGALLERIRGAEPRLRVVGRPNTGIVGALNDGLALARGEFVARMDADDLCHPERFARQVDFLRAHPSCVAVGSAFRFVDARGAHLKECARPLDHEVIEKELLQGNGGILIHPATMFRREAIARVGAYRELAQWVEDLDLYLRLARVGQLANLPEVLLHYRLHEQSVNFTRNAGRHERKIAVLADAYAARGLEFDARRFPSHFTSEFSADELRDFAVSTLRFGADGRPWRYVWRAILKEPRARASWRTLSYVLKHRLGLIKP